MKFTRLALIILALSIAALGQSLPKPKLKLVSVSDGTNNGYAVKVYVIEVVNRTDILDEFFIAAPVLPPCGNNTNAARTWINLYDDRSVRIYGWCAIKSNSELASLGFMIRASDTQPKKIFIDLVDRFEGIILRSNKITIQ
ncbi:MAG: hypothetical protein PSX80_16805 [bacterium]|nr:hypothetical protein [bacterium]